MALHLCVCHPTPPSQLHFSGAEARDAPMGEDPAVSVIPPFFSLASPLSYGQVYLWLAPVFCGKVPLLRPPCPLPGTVD